MSPLGLPPPGGAAVVGHTGMDVIVLDRVDDIRQDDTPYCVHGRALCTGGCGHWLWLGNRSHDVIIAGLAVPLCHPCARRLVSAGKRPLRNAGDHRRADGTHS